MVKQTTPSKESSNMIWDNLEEMVRMRVRDYIEMTKSSDPGLALNQRPE